MAGRAPWREWLRNPLTVWLARRWRTAAFRWRSRGRGIRIGYAARVEDSRMDAHAAVHPFASLIHSSLGAYSYLASHASASNATIGSFCSIGPYAMIGLGRHPSRDYVSTHPAFFSVASRSQPTFVTRGRFEESVPVALGHDVWIGAHALIADGVTVGDGAIVAAGSVVVADVPAYTIVGGVPARTLRERFPPEVAERIRRSRWWERGEAWWRQNADSFTPVEAFLALLEREAPARDDAGSSPAPPRRAPGPN